MITPAEIKEKQFATTRIKEGYDQSEVDDFLDRVEVDYRQLSEQHARQVQEIAQLRRALDAARAASSDAVTTVLPVPAATGAERILVAAQRTADQVEAEANMEAGKIRAVARAEAENIKAVAEGERQAILNQLETERTALVEAIEVLKAKRAGYKSWLRAALAKIEEEEANV
ncbi:DivIVA domain-containing protein [Streptomyces sp. NPDC012769]|uniref:DivIVA domain-containing protein n=1 Tax=Streptomyces sp. NPDC012769 TaxID=3364848 RepID=UPI00369B4525